MSVAIVDYGSGNLNSARKAFERAARDAGSAQSIEVTSDPDRIRAADRIVLPGVGAFADCMAGLRAVPGLLDAMTEAVHQDGKPFLGICVGMQLLATRGLEHREVSGLDWIAGDVALIEPADPALKIPHMGWNTLEAQRPHPLLEGIATGPDGLHAYFVHSYHLNAADPADVVAASDYAGPITAIVARDNIVGTQFHPEKSPDPGARADREFSRVGAMMLFPAIDLKNGECVRLLHGDMDTATVFNTDPAAQAERFEQQGFTYLHIVDLDGAFSAGP